MSNPAEVAKTRLQLQGELMKTGNYQKMYSNTFDVLGKTFQKEGLKGIQRGLTAAYAYSVSLPDSWSALTDSKIDRLYFKCQYWVR